FPLSTHGNSRYAHLTGYREAAQQYDGLLFGSSRANTMSGDDLSRRFGNVHFAVFAMDSGTIADHLPMLEYVLRDKTARHESLRAVFLLLDIDSLGNEPRANRYLSTLHPPELTGEPPAHFWRKNLTAIQFQSWRAVVRAAAGFHPRLQSAPEQPGQ